MANPLTSKWATRLLDDRIDRWYGEGYKEFPSIIEKFYTIAKDKKAWLEIFGLGDIPDPVLFNGIVTYQDVAPGYHTKIEALEYAGGIVVERMLLETDRYDKVEKMSKKLGRAMTRKRNKLAVETFTQADSSAFTFMTSEEGVALASNSHTTKATGVSTSTGFDNLVTTAFDAPSLEAARLLGKGLLSDIGERREEANFDTIVYPCALAEDVWQVINTPGEVDEITNTLNFQKGRWKAVEVDQWDVDDTNDWCIVDSAAMKEAMVWHDLVPPEFNATKDFDTMMRKYISYCACACGFGDWRWIVFASVS